MSLLIRPRVPVPGASTAAPAWGSPININDALIASNGSNVFDGLWIENTSYTSNSGACILVTTTQPVIIQNCVLKAQKYCVDSTLNGNNVTVRNCIGLVRNTTQANQPCHRFLNIESGATIVCENNTMIGGGIYVYQQASSGGLTLCSIRFNVARNIDGRLSDGAGGYVFERANTANVYFQAKQFLQMNDVRGATNVEVAWNQVENDPFVSRPEDNINIYGSSGTAGSPINIHDNFISGGWPTRPFDIYYSGGGIICDKGTATDWTDEATVATKYVNIDDNQVVGLVQHGISAPYGNHINARRNRIICPNKLRGTTILSANVGAYIGGALVASVRGFTNNLVWDSNVIGCVNAGGSQNNSSVSGINSSGVASASGGTKTRVTLTHGLTSGDNGRTLPVYSGANWTPGDYVLTYVDSTHLDLDVAWNASFGNPVIRSRTVDITNTTSVPFPTEADAHAELAIWRAKSAGVRIGSTLAV